MLLLSFANAATLLNPHATRVTLLYSMEFDPSGNLLGMTIRVSVSMCYLHTGLEEAISHWSGKNTNSI